MEYRIRAFISAVALWLLGFGAGVLSLVVLDSLGPPAVLLFASALAPTYSWRITLRAAPEKFDFERYADEVGEQAQIVQHVSIAVVAVAVGTLLGAVAANLVEPRYPLGLAIGLPVAMFSSHVLGLNALVRINDDYLADDG